jgi:hypothetical protein
MSALTRFCLACMVLFAASSAVARHLYLSDTPGLCAPAAASTPDHYYIFAHSPDNSDFRQASLTEQRRGGGNLPRTAVVAEDQGE